MLNAAYGMPFSAGSLKCIPCDEGDNCKEGKRMGCNLGYIKVEGSDNYICRPCQPGKYRY